MKYRITVVTETYGGHGQQRIAVDGLSTDYQKGNPMLRHLKTHRLGVVLVGLLAGALLMSSCATTATKGSSSTTPTTPPSTTAAPQVVSANTSFTTLQSPAIPGVSALPGPVAKPANPSANMGVLDVSPDSGFAGAPMTISGSHLPANAKVELTWSTANATWQVQTAPDTVNYLGRADTLFAVVIANTTTNASGAFSVSLKVPQDWGGLHDIYAVINGVEDAHGGFITLRTVTVTPRSGPIGTPITITYSGLGATLYTGGASLLWDNHYVGEMMANWTRGVAQVTIRAAGPVGVHTIQIGNAISYMYLNVPQSPIPYTNGATVSFTVTKDDGPPAASIDWPVNVAPTVTARTTLATSGLLANSSVKATLATTKGPVDTSVALSASGLTKSAPVKLVWSTVVGNRVNCASVCWAFVSQSLGSATPSGGSLQATITVPDGLGGWHVVQLVQNGKIVAQVPFYVEESIVGQGVSSITVKEGQSFTIHLKGVGWTQLDNTVAVDYDNSYVGYACGFNSNGDVLLHLNATGGPGTHLIDLYPMLYSLSPSFAETPYGMVPVLTYAHDEPALALGYRLPAFRFAITVVK
ncbi:MAG: hypothetical protein ACLQK4_04775 [Acidimicrobiales bacterium]|jgi:hypothetical protein